MLYVAVYAIGGVILTIFVLWMCHVIKNNAITNLFPSNPPPVFNHMAQPPGNASAQAIGMTILRQPEQGTEYNLKTIQNSS